MATLLPYAGKVIIQSNKAIDIMEIATAFGDGYAQVAGNGLKPARDTWSITIKPLTLLETYNFEIFLGSVGTWGAIRWTPSWETIEKQFKLTSAKREQLTTTSFSFSLNLIEI